MSVDEDASKDRFFESAGELAQEMIAAHGKDFAMGVLILTARFIAEGKPVGLARVRRRERLSDPVCPNGTVAAESGSQRNISGRRKQVLCAAGWRKRAVHKSAARWHAPCLFASWFAVHAARRLCKRPSTFGRTSRCLKE